MAGLTLLGLPGILTIGGFQILEVTGLAPDPILGYGLLQGVE